MKYLLTIYLIIHILSSCETKRSKSITLNINFFYSIQILELKKLESLHLLNFNDSAKWIMYLLHCDDSCSEGGFRNNRLLNSKPIAFLDIKLVGVFKETDTLSLLYYFLYDDSTSVHTIASHKTLTDGILFDLKNDTVIGYIHGEGILKTMGPTSRYTVPLQPDVKKFLNKNKANLNPWLFSEAIRRKVIS